VLSTLDMMVCSSISISVAFMILYPFLYFIQQYLQVDFIVFAYIRQAAEPGHRTSHAVKPLLYKQAGNLRELSQ
jgi:hypothetical protein